MLTNGHLAELLALAAEDEAGHRARALRRAARAALTWPREAAAEAEDGRPLTGLPAVGPWVAARIERWLAEDREPPEPPPVRRGFLTLVRARAVLAAAPSEISSPRGDLQAHTVHSDGRATVREMADAAASRGYEYLAVTDHSRGLPVARGMDEERLAAAIAEVDAVNRELETESRSLRLLRGLEMNLTPDGEGDMDPPALARLDLVLGAFHSRLRVAEDQTARYLAAVRNPEVHVLAHPRGRRWNARTGLRADWRRVMEEAAAQGTALEVDAFPDRQDLDVELLGVAAEEGVTVSIGTDAHRVSELAHMELGLAAVIVAGVPRERVLNFRPRREILDWAAGLRAGAGG